MTRTQKILAAVILLLLLIALALLFLRRPSDVTNLTPEEQAAANQRPGGLGGNSFPSPSFNTNISDPATNAAPPPKPDEQGNMKRIAAAFAERYGSYSNVGDFENVLDLKVYMTESMQAWADSYVAEARTKPRSAEYAGTTTRAISVDVSAIDEGAGTASLTVKTQRRETGSTVGSDRVYYQDLKFEFLKSGDVWKVNSVAWVPL